MSDSNSIRQIMVKPFTWFLTNWWKLGIVFLVILSAYAFYLDAQIKDRFSGNKWQVPAQIYARPLQIQNGQDLYLSEVQQELDLLGYRKVSKVTKVGEYQASKNSVVVYRRAFTAFWGPEPKRKLRIEINSNKVSSIVDLANQSNMSNVHLEPWLVTRLVSNSKEDRMLITLEEVPDALVQALVLTEDRDFYRHSGVAPLAILRAAVANISAGRTVQGGSTLTQQLVKNLFLTREKSIVRKAKEALMALLVERRYSKEEILQAYLNEVFIGQNGNKSIHGFGLASYFYFDRPIQELSLPEMATLVAMIKGPSLYNPRKRPETVVTRRDMVLRLLYEHEYLASNEYERMVQEPLGVVAKGSLSKRKHPAFMDKVNRELNALLAGLPIKDSGIKVFTTLDTNAQLRAEKVLKQRLGALEKQRNVSELNGAFIVSEIDSGEVRVLIGDRNTEFQGFNRALDARRAIGSIIKPAVYLTALELAESYNLATPLKDEPIKLKSSFGNFWEPKNADKKYRGQVPLLTALSKSLNVPTVHLGMQVGIDNVANTMNRLGVKQSLSGYPSMLLGAANLTPFEVNQAYQTLSNRGRYVPLHTVSAITTNENELMWRFATKPKQTVDEDASYLVNYALHKVTREGTASRLRDVFPKINFAGKTGTTDDFRDSWFSGFDKEHLGTVWIGKDDNESTKLSGAAGALDIYVNFQKSQKPRSLVRRFPSTLGIAHFDPNSGQLIEPGCSDAMSVPAILEVLPKEAQPCHIAQQPEKDDNAKKGFWERLFGG